MNVSRRLATALAVSLLFSAQVGCRRTAPARCSDLIAAVVGGQPFPPGFAPLWEPARLAYECRVVETDDAAICEHFPIEVRDNCRARYIFWHGARVRAADTPWEHVMADGIAADCRNPAAGIPPPVCDQLVGAIRTADPARCGLLGGMPGRMCRGIAGANPQACEGNRDCEELASRLALLRRGGLPAVEREGTEVDRAEAAAVLGRPNACAPLVERLRSQCAAAAPGPR